MKEHDSPNEDIRFFGKCEMELLGQRCKVRRIAGANEISIVQPRLTRVWMTYFFHRLFQNFSKTVPDAGSMWNHSTSL
jgi:hypothetical protein